jgi:hypothetical protein
VFVAMTLLVMAQVDLKAEDLHLIDSGSDFCLSPHLSVFAQNSLDYTQNCLVLPSKKGPGFRGVALGKVHFYSTDRQNNLPWMRTAIVWYAPDSTMGIMSHYGSNDFGLVHHLDKKPWSSWTDLLTGEVVEFDLTQVVEFDLTRPGRGGSGNGRLLFMTNRRPHRVANIASGMKLLPQPISGSSGVLPSQILYESLALSDSARDATLAAFHSFVLDAKDTAEIVPSHISLFDAHLRLGHRNYDNILGWSRLGSLRQEGLVLSDKKRSWCHRFHEANPKKPSIPSISARRPTQPLHTMEFDLFGRAAFLFQCWL